MTAIAALAAAGAAGCFIGIVSEPDETWMRLVYLFGLGLSPLVVLGLLSAARIRREAVARVVLAAQQIEQDVNVDLTSVHGGRVRHPESRRPERSHVILVLHLGSIRQFQWQLFEMGARREAEILERTHRDLAAAIRSEIHEAALTRRWADE